MSTIEIVLLSALVATVVITVASQLWETHKDSQRGKLTAHEEASFELQKGERL